MAQLLLLQMGSREATKGVEMKGMITKSLIVVIAIALSPLVEAKVEGGSIDLRNGSISLIEEGVEGQLVVGANLPVVNDNHEGSLYLVYPSGRSRILSGGYRDRRGATIQAVRNSQDKVIYLDRSGEISGGFGLSNSDLFSIIRSNPRRFGKAYQTYKMLRKEKDLLEKLMAVQIAADVFESRLSRDEQMEIFLTTIKMIVGREFSDAVQAIVSHDGEISWGDNGGFDSGNPIAWGDNGGFDYPIVIQGYSHSFDLPDLPEENLYLGGMTLIHVD